MGTVIQQNKVALITGAASGVGFAIAKLCRSKGMHLALLDIDQTNLVKAKVLLHDLNPSLLTEAYVIDVADVEIWKATAQQIAKLFRTIDLVVLNAGKGYQAQGQNPGRLNAWLDGDYWQKVYHSSFYPLSLGPYLPSRYWIHTNSY
jgi:NAD(P)-dependent dehydrogenase (short-subunit alcohol dehydrogenase family)